MIRILKKKVKNVVWLECDRCRYVWNYKGLKTWYASCPNCKRSVHIDRQTIVKPSQESLDRQIAVERLKRQVQRIAEKLAKLESEKR